VGREALAPRAQVTDQSSVPPRENFAALAAAGLLGLTVPVAYGGMDADGVLTLQVMEVLARHCCATAFLLTQHIGVCRSLAASEAARVPDLLPLLARGDLIAAIGASQLRRAGGPVLQAARVPGGYVLNGQVPWASGYGLMTHIALGATVPDVGPLFFWVPFQEAPGLAVGPAQDLAVMRASVTVPLTCTDLFVADSCVVGDDRGGYWRAQHGGALSSNPTAFLLGVGAACLDDIRWATARAGRAAQVQRAESLAQEFMTLRDQFYALLQRQPEGMSTEQFLDAMLDTRIAVTTLVFRLAQIAMAAVGGSANLRSNPAQRHLREAAFFLTATVNSGAREALVLRL
jgi:alkylation response protein AidB-like acyl-CoA dehydrogenase